MNSYLLQIKPSNETTLDFFFNELSILIESFKTENHSTKLINVPASNCALLTTTNLQLRFALSKNSDYISIPYNTLP
ncbi:MAG TPA: hypothetical protein VN698_06230 [Bacteroidia bacterium]|nr:hypothetical protein [Bacteroidia bacterium]